MEWSSLSSRPLVLQKSVEGTQTLSFQEAANLVTNDKKRLTTVQRVTSTKYNCWGTKYCKYQGITFMSCVFFFFLVNILSVSNKKKLP